MIETPHQSQRLVGFQEVLPRRPTKTPGLITGLYSTNESKEIVIIIDLLQFSVTQSEVLKSRV